MFQLTQIGLSRSWVSVVLLSELYNQGYHVYQDTSLDKWWSVRIQTKWLWVRIPLQSRKKLFTHLDTNVAAAYGTAKCSRLNSPKTLKGMICVRESTRSEETETS